MGDLFIIKRRIKYLWLVASILRHMRVGLIYYSEIRMGPGPSNVTDSQSGGPRGLPHYNVRGVSNSMAKTSGDK